MPNKARKTGSANIKMVNCTANTSSYKCISLALDLPLYIASPIGLISFPTGFIILVTQETNLVYSSLVARTLSIKRTMMTGTAGDMLNQT